jgi:hypothetical protein
MLAKWQANLFYKQGMSWTSNLAVVAIVLLFCKNLTTCMKAHCNKVPKILVAIQSPPLPQSFGYSDDKLSKLSCSGAC